MKTIIIIFIMMLGCMKTEAQNNSYKLFRITQNLYSEKDDLAQAVVDEFGEKYEMADWNDVKQFEDVISKWVDCLPLTDELAVFVTSNGQHWWNNTNRHFFFQYFANQDPFTGFLAHDELGENLLCLGSWYDVQMPVLCKLKDEVFKVSTNTYSETENLEQALANEMGEKYSLLDWRDIKDYENNIECWAAFVNLNDDATFWVTNDGSHFWNDPRHYFVQCFTDHQPNLGFLAHEQLGNNLLCLGSWYSLNLHIVGMLEESVGINPLNPSAINVFPNPVSEILYIHSNYEYATFHILDMYGKIIQKSSNANSIDVHSLLPGFYILKMTTEKDKMVFCKKIIKN